MENITVRISINGTAINGYKMLQLNQGINNHHQFILTLDLATAETEDALILDKSKSWLGKKISIMYGSKQFSGVVSNIEMGKKFDHGIVKILGYSDTYLLESAETLYSWTDKTLKDIVQEVVDRAGIKAQIKPEYTGKIAYESQYSEKDFQFIKRLAKEYHEWLYYDGTQLLFGKPEPSGSVSLTFGTDLETMNIGIQTLAKPSTSFSYSSKNVEQHDASSPNTPSGLDLLGQTAFNASLELFKTPGNKFSDQRINAKSELYNHSKKVQESQVAQSHYINATSECTDLAVGTVVDISSSLLQAKGIVVTKPVSSYIITEISHTIGERERYVNRFTAIPAGVPTLPEPNVDVPTAHTQMAKVISNEDPDKKGRVQVQMLWQTGAMKTSWIRVMTPDAGCSDQVKTNRGFVFIPEVDDEVLVGFRYNNPNRPYVMGSLFNGRTGAGGGADNNIKSITTRSGHTLQFDDTDGKESITVTDKNQNIIYIDTAGESIRISAPRNIDIEAENITINAKENLKFSSKNQQVNVGENLEEKVGKNKQVLISKKLEVSAKESTEEIADKKSVKVTDKMEQISGNLHVKTNKGKMLIDSKDRLTLQSDADINYGN